MHILHYVMFLRMHKFFRSRRVKRALPSKLRRQRALVRSVKSGDLSSLDAVERARLIPKAMVREFKVVSWPDQ